MNQLNQFKGSLNSIAIDFLFFIVVINISYMHNIISAILNICKYTIQGYQLSSQCCTPPSISKIFFYYLKQIFCNSQAVTAQTSFPQAPVTANPLYVYEFSYSSCFQRDEIMQYLSFVSGLFHIAYCFPSSFLLQHV